MVYTVTSTKQSMTEARPKQPSDGVSPPATAAARFLILKIRPLLDTIYPPLETIPIVIFPAEINCVVIRIIYIGNKP